VTSNDTQHDDHIWLTWCGEGWAIERIEDDVIFLWRGYAPDLEFLKVRWSRTYWPDYAERAARMLREEMS
jgi:hypothetical protein